MVTKLKKPAKLSMPMRYRVQPTPEMNAKIREWRTNQTWEPDREAEGALWRDLEEILGRPIPPREQVRTLAAA